MAGGRFTAIIGFASIMTIISIVKTVRLFRGRTLVTDTRDDGILTETDIHARQSHNLLKLLYVIAEDQTKRAGYLHRKLHLSR